MGGSKRRDEMLIASNAEDENGYGSVDNANDTQRHLVRHQVLQRARNRLLVAAILSLVVMIAEIGGGYLADSLAVVTDAAHMLVDFLGFIIALLAICLARKQPSQRLTHGWHRAEILGALFSVLIIWVMTGVLIYFGVKRAMADRLQIDSNIMIITASIGLAINFVLGFILNFTCDGGSCKPTVAAFGATDTEHQSVNLRAATLHVIGDILQSLSILIAAIILYFRPDLTIIDPILTIIFSVFVFLTTCRLFRDIILILMEAKPPSIDYADARRRLVEIDGVEGVHSLRIWSLTNGVHVITVHLVIASLYDGEPVNARSILKEARHILETKYGVLYSTVQVEYSDDGMAFLCARTPGPSD